MRKLIVAVIVSFFCHPAIAQSIPAKALPHVIIYKTKANYNDLVPVMLSADKKTVESYPGPADVTTGSGYTLPVVLHKGYLLDRRGVGASTAFLRLTCQQYSKLQTVPAPAGLYKLIKDKNPLTELYDCGIRSTGKNVAKELNELIDKHQLRTKCKPLTRRKE